MELPCRDNIDRVMEFFGIRRFPVVIMVLWCLIASYSSLAVGNTPGFGLGSMNGFLLYCSNSFELPCEVYILSNMLI
jgi:hypothetical protein